MVLVVGILALFLPAGFVQIWSGIFCIIAAVIVGIFQSGIPFVNRLLGFILEVFYWRALIYIGLSIPTFFNNVTIAGGVCLILLGLAYGIAAFFFKEREYLDKATVAQKQEKNKTAARNADELDL